MLPLPDPMLWSRRLTSAGRSHPGVVGLVGPVGHEGAAGCAHLDRRSGALGPGDGVDGDLVGGDRGGARVGEQLTASSSQCPSCRRDGRSSRRRGGGRARPRSGLGAGGGVGRGVEQLPPIGAGDGRCRSRTGMRIITSPSSTVAGTRTVMLERVHAPLVEARWTTVGVAFGSTTDDAGRRGVGGVVRSSVTVRRRCRCRPKRRCASGMPPVGGAVAEVPRPRGDGSVGVDRLGAVEGAGRARRRTGREVGDRGEVGHLDLDLRVVVVVAPRLSVTVRVTV